MSKAKNKGKEPKQNENKAVEELDEKIEGSSVDTEETEEEAEDASEDTESETADEVDSDDEEEQEEKKPKRKAKKDPVPAVMIVLIYAVIISAVLYYVLPFAFAPSFGYTLDQFNDSLEQLDISKRLQAQYTTLVPRFKHVDKNSIKEIWGIKGEVSPEDQKRLEARFKPFVNTYAATEELEHILVEANTRVTDGQLTRMCIYCTYDNQHLSMMMVHFGAVLANFFPGMTFNEAVSRIMEFPFESNSSARYVVQGDIAQRICAENIGGQQTYIKLEVVPAKAVKPDQIIPSETAATTAAPAETGAAAPAA